MHAEPPPEFYATDPDAMAETAYAEDGPGFPPYVRERDIGAQRILLNGSVALVAGATTVWLSPPELTGQAAAWALGAAAATLALSYLLRHRRSWDEVLATSPHTSCRFSTGPRRQLVIALIPAIGLIAAAIGATAVLTDAFRRDTLRAAVVAGLAAGHLVWILWRYGRLARLERGTGRWVLRRTDPTRVFRRTYATTNAAATILDPFGSGRHTAADQIDEVLAVAATPYERWAIFLGTGRHDEALAVAEAAFAGGDLTAGGWAALTCLRAGRSDEAEAWIQRSVDAGYDGEISPGWVKALRPLHRSAAWRALRAQTR